MPTYVFEHKARNCFVRSSNGLAARRQFTINATSDVNAEALLFSESAIQIGVPYVNIYGETPDAACICQTIEIDPRVPAPADGSGSRGLYDATVSYGYVLGTSQNGPQPGEIVVSIKKGQTSEPVDHDLNGKPITNKVGEPYDPPLTRLRLNRTLEIRWMKDYASWGAAYDYSRPYEDKVNSATFYGAPPKCIYCAGIEIANTEIVNPNGGKPYWLFTGEFIFRPERILKDDGQNITVPGWVDAVVHRGRRTLALDEDGNLTGGFANILDDNGSRVSEPALLNRTGTDTIDEDDARRDGPVLQLFEHYSTVDFNGLFQ